MWFTVKIILAHLAMFAMVLQKVHSQDFPQQQQQQQLSPSELQTLLNFLYAPDDELFALQRAALRQQLHSLLEQQEQQQLQQGPTDDYYFVDNDKRSITTLVRNNSPLPNGKRSLAALARTGQILHANPTSVLDEMKRSLASLAKTGQLPSQEPEAEDGQLDEDSWQDGHDNKRSLGALARSGNLLQTNGKRSLASLRKNGMMPYVLLSADQKRSLAALARGNMLPEGGGTKRNIGAMARDFALPNQKSRMDSAKRNLGALKSSPVHGRKKREIDESSDDNFGMSEAGYQSSPIDYDDLIAGLESSLYPPSLPRHTGQKRFLGRHYPPVIVRPSPVTNHRQRL